MDYYYLLVLLLLLFTLNMYILAKHKPFQT